MNIIIAGGGMMGMTLAQNLVDKHTVTVVDPDEAQCKKIFREIGAITIVGNATNPKVLVDGHIKQADVAIGMMRNDSDNLTFCLLARRYGVKRVVVRMRDKNFYEAYTLAQADHIIYEIDKVITNFVSIIEHPLINSVIDTGYPALIMVVITIRPEHWIAGKQIKEVSLRADFPHDVRLVALQDNHGVMLPAHGNAVILEDRDIIISSSSERIDDIVSYLTQSNHNA